MDGNITRAVYDSLNAPNVLNGHLLLVGYVVVSALIIIKTKNAVIPFIIGLFFLALFRTWLSALGIKILILVLVFELAVILFRVFWKDSA
jgi:hypothetical protein